LVVRKQYDRSGRIWVQQALVAHPELLLVKEKAAGAGEIDVYETIYGPKNFAPTYPGEPLFNEAVVARCGDVATCNQLAAMFHAVAPRERVEPVCGVPPATTGGFGRVAELAADRLLAPPATSAAAVASCARLHACAARERVSLPRELDCARRLRPEWTACAASDSCSSVASCLSEKAR
jgi:hypothetical protein